LAFVFIDVLDELHRRSFFFLKIKIFVKIFAVDFQIIVVLFLFFDFTFGSDIIKG